MRELQGVAFDGRSHPGHVLAAEVRALRAERPPTVTVNYPHSGCPQCGSIERHAHDQVEWIDWKLRSALAELDEVHQFGLDLGLRPAPHIRLDVASVLGTARDLVAPTPQPAAPETVAVRDVVQTARFWKSKRDRLGYPRPYVPFNLDSETCSIPEARDMYDAIAALDRLTEAAPDRPTREQVDALPLAPPDVLAAHAVAKLRKHAEEYEDDEVEALLSEYDRLVAEVRALRVALEQQQRFTEVWRRGHQETSIGTRAEIDRLRASLVARTPQPAEAVLSQAGAHAWDAADAVAVQLTRAVTAVLDRCNDEIENRPGCSCAGPPDFGDGVYGSHEGDCESQEPPMLHAAEVRDLLTGVAPLPDIPDGSTQ